jgi:hypothetical protein
MKNKFFTLIQPCLSIFDNGKFFRKPFVWLYALLAIVSFIAPFFLVYSAFRLNSTYQNRELTRTEYQGVLLPELTKISTAYDSLTINVEKFGQEMNTAIENLTTASKKADSYREYASYGEEYLVEYKNAESAKKEWETAYAKATAQWDTANKTLEKLKPRYEKIKKEYQLAEQNYVVACQKFASSDIIGNAYIEANAKRSQVLIAFIIYSIVLLLVGWFNFQLWWNRMFKLEETYREGDLFVATPVATHFLQTLGESLGFLLAVLGFFNALTYSIFHVCFGGIGANYLNWGISSLFLPILVGFAITFSFRVFAELVLSIVVIANNSKKS